MKTKLFTWTWPLSFLAALGQLLLLLTQNHAGPPLGRFLLSCWVLCIPGFWLGHLLIKPELRLPEALGLRFSLALAVNYLALSLSHLFSPQAPALFLVTLSVVVSLVYTSRPRRRSDGLRLTESDRAAGQLAALIAVVLLGLHLWAGGSAPPGPGRVPGGSLYYPWLEMMARTSGLSPEQVFGFLPGVMAPLLFLSLCLLGWVILNKRWLGLCAGLLGILLLSLPGGGEGLRWAGYPSRMALIPFWSAVALLLDGLQDSRPPQIPAWLLLVLAAVATTFGFTYVMGLVFVLLGLRSFTSISRLQEGLPFFVAYVVPAVLVIGLYALLHREAIGVSLQARGLYVLGPGKWILDPLQLSFPERTAWLLSLAFLPVLWRQGLQKPRVFYLITATFTVFVLGYNPWVLPKLESIWKSSTHILPWLTPIPIVVTALAHWAVHGLRRSHGLVWMRVLVLAGTGVILVSGIILSLTHFAYTPGRVQSTRATVADTRGFLDAMRVGSEKAETRSPMARPPEVLFYPQVEREDTLSYTPGDTLAFLVSWNWSPKRGENRLRVELHPARPVSRNFLERCKHSAGGLWNWAAKRDRWVALEIPLAPEYLDAHSLVVSQTVRVPIPLGCPPGSYELRTAALTGRRSPDRICSGYLFLKQTQGIVAVSSGPAR